MIPPRLVCAAPLFILLCAVAAAQPPREPTPSKLLPPHHNIPYGPHERNVLDLWPATSASPTPVLIYFHGGGFVGGDKWTLDPGLLDACLKAGISVASANYRFSQHAPFPAPMLDGARAVQFLRTKAVEWNLDPKRIAMGGSSAGAGISLWVGFKDELADAKAVDPVLRESSRVSAIVIFGGQSSYDPRFIREHIGGRAWEHPALPKLFAVTPEELDSPRAVAQYEQASMINFVTKDDPPVYGFYTEAADLFPPGPNTGPALYYPGFGKEIEGAQKPGQGIHHPRFGYMLRERMQAAGLECVIRHRDEMGEGKDAMAAVNTEIAAFLAGHFGMK